MEARRARRNIASDSVTTAVAGDNPSREFPAHAFSVSRRRNGGAAQGAQCLLFPPSDITGNGGSGVSGGRDSLQSPRFAAAGEGQSYPERLQVSAAPIPEGALGGVVVGMEGRPALPELTADDVVQLTAGQRVQKQTRQGGAGSGSVVVDVRADTDVVLGLLTKYKDYAEMIDTVRQCTVFPGEPGDPDTQKVCTD